SDAQSVLNLTAEDDTKVMLYAVWVVNSYTVSYDANGGTGRTESSSHSYDLAKTLMANGFKRTGYTFSGWAARSNGATIYKNEESVSNLTSENDETLTLYTVWKGNSYTMNYDANGGMGNVASSRHTYGVAKALTANGFLRTGYVFTGWSTSPDGAVIYADEQDIMNITSVNGTTVTLYAVWKPVYWLSVVGGTGSGSYAATTRVSITADETPSGKVFDRWISSNGGTFDAATHVSTTFTMPDQDVIVTATYRDAAILPTPSAPPLGQLKPASIQVDEATGSMLISINIASLPEGTTAIKLPSGEIVSIDANASVLKLQLSQNEWEKYEQLVLVALNGEHIPSSSYVIDLSEEARQVGPEDSDGFFSILVWIVVSVLVIGGAMTAILIFLNKKKK
ncbi:MAG TPA: InlB B-repeat-containing protein, partial [Oscillospiraceae bacterium]|nr:InlB B-repeat-containing protein [Oscillospiraceae bacterium]